MKQLFFLAVIFALMSTVAYSQAAKDIHYRDSLDASGDLATATTSARGYENFKAWRTDFQNYMVHAIHVKFTKVTDSVKLQAAITNFGQDTTWVDVQVRNTIQSAINTGAGSKVSRDTVRTWISDVGVDAGFTYGPFLVEPQYIGRAMRVVTGVLDTGKTYINQIMKTGL